MLKYVLLIITITVVFNSAAHKSSFAQDFGRPVMAKIAQNSIIGGLGGMSLMTVVWATDPLNPEFKLIDMAIVGIAFGIIGGFSWGVYSSSLAVRSYDQYQRKSADELYDSSQPQDNDQGNQEENQYHDYGDIFEDDRNYFDQIDEVNDNGINVPIDAIRSKQVMLKKKFDPTLFPENIDKSQNPQYELVIASYHYTF